MSLLTDTSPFPFGKHRGQEMQDVPASYYHWLWHKAGYNSRPEDSVSKYIKENMSALKTEDEDLIWD